MGSSSPIFGVKIKKYLKAPPSYYCTSFYPCNSTVAFELLGTQVIQFHGFGVAKHDLSVFHRFGMGEGLGKKDQNKGILNEDSDT